MDVATVAGQAEPTRHDLEPTGDVRLVEAGVGLLADPDGLVEDDASVAATPGVVGGGAHAPDALRAEDVDDGDVDLAVLVGETEEVAGLQVLIGELELVGGCRCCVGHVDQPLSSVESRNII